MTLLLSNECVFNSLTTFWDIDTINDLSIDENTSFYFTGPQMKKRSHMTETNIKSPHHVIRGS